MVNHKTRKKEPPIAEKFKKEVNKLEKKEKRLEVFILISGIISSIGFAVSLFSLGGISGGAIGASRENLYGIIFVIGMFLAWSLIVISWLRKNMKKRDKVDIKKLLKETER